MAEGLIEKLEPKELVELQDVERDEHGRIRLAEVDLARKIKVEVQGRFSERGIRVTLANKQIGYELGCADPIAFDAAYCQELGYAAVRFLLGGWQRRHGVRPGWADGSDSIRGDAWDGGRQAGPVYATSTSGATDIGWRANTCCGWNRRTFADAVWVRGLAEAANLSSDQLRRALRPSNDGGVIHEPAMAMKRIGIVVGGGPAPGTNAVIAATVIEAVMSRMRTHRIP